MATFPEPLVKAWFLGRASVTRLSFTAATASELEAQCAADLTPLLPLGGDETPAPDRNPEPEAEAHDAPHRGAAKKKGR